MTVRVDLPTEAILVNTVPDIHVYDHVRPTSADTPDGVYRVVGVSETVTLLRVGDADGRRVTTGEIHRIDRDALDGFETAENPDDGWAITATLAGLPNSIYWQLRTFVRTLAANPISAAIASVLLVVGSLEAPGVTLPEPVSTGLVFVGALGLAYVGSGRL